MKGTLDTILGQGAVEGFSSAGALKRGLPSAAYTSQDFFKLEQERVFTRNWALAGFAHELPEPGGAVPVTVGGAPIVLIHGMDGRIRAFHNVCRHRGTKLVDRPCQGLKTLVCPYHNWTYALDGRLMGTPHFGGPRQHKIAGFDYADHGLVEARSGRWHDWIFVNVSGDASDFEDFLAPVKRHIGDLDLGGIEPLFKIDSGVFQANWKFICGNFVEPYHVPVAHPETAAGQPLEEHYMVRDGHMVGCAIDVEPKDEGKPARARELCLDISARYLLLFPNFLFFIYFGPDTQINVMLNTPLAADRTHQRRVVYQLGGERPPRDKIEAWRSLANEVIAEDRAMVERVQEGRHSPVMNDGGVFSPAWEASEHAFETLIMDAVA